MRRMAIVGGDLHRTPYGPERRIVLRVPLELATDLVIAAKLRSVPVDRLAADLLERGLVQPDPTGGT